MGFTKIDVKRLYGVPPTRYFPPMCLVRLRRLLGRTHPGRKGALNLGGIVRRKEIEGVPSGPLQDSVGWVKCLLRVPSFHSRMSRVSAPPRLEDWGWSNAENVKRRGHYWISTVDVVSCLFGPETS